MRRWRALSWRGCLALGCLALGCLALAGLMAFAAAMVLTGASRPSAGRVPSWPASPRTSTSEWVGDDGAAAGASTAAEAAAVLAAQRLLACPGRRRDDRSCGRLIDTQTQGGWLDRDTVLVQLAGRLEPAVPGPQVGLVLRLVMRRDTSGWQLADGPR